MKVCVVIAALVCFISTSRLPEVSFAASDPNRTEQTITTKVYPYTDSPIETYGVPFDGTKLTLSLPMRGTMMVMTSSISHKCYPNSSYATYTQDCYAIDFFNDKPRQPVYPVAAGRVVFAGRDTVNTYPYGWTQYGNSVLVEHGTTGYTTLYAHMEELTVKEGDIVDTSTKIGVEGCSGGGGYDACTFIGTGPHVHFAMYYGDVNLSKDFWSGGKSVAIGYSSTSSTFANCQTLSGKSCTEFYKQRGAQYPQDQQIKITDAPTVLTSPVQSAPIAGYSSDRGIWPTLEWQPNPGELPPNGYRIQVSTNASFSSLIVDECRTTTSYSTTDTRWMRTKLGKMHWRVAYVKKPWTDLSSCKSAGLTGSWSSSRNFTNSVVFANPPVLSSPSSGTTTTDGMWPTLSWNPGSGTEAVYGYRIQVSWNSWFFGTDVDECRMVPNYRPDSDSWMRGRQGKFFWRVYYVAADWKGNQATCKTIATVGLNSELRNFTVAATAPVTRTPTVAAGAPPVLQSPSAGASTTDGIWPTLRWTLGAGATAQNGYHVQVSQVENFASTIVDQCTPASDPSYRPTDDWWMRRYPGRLYWRVSYAKNAWADQAACKSVGIIGNWSTPRWFYNNVVVTPTFTRTPTPGPITINPPVLSSPSTGTSTSDGIWPVLRWADGAGASAPYGYHVQVSTSSNFAAPIVDQCTPPNEQYYQPKDIWWMQAKTNTLHWRVGYAKAAWGTNQETCKAVGLNGGWSSPRWFVNNYIKSPTPSHTKVPTAVPATITPSRSPTSTAEPLDAELTAPVLKSPANNATNTSSKQELDWEDVTAGNVSWYEVEICIETRRGSGDWNCDKYRSDGPTSKWNVWSRTGKIFPQRLIRWQVNANDGSLDGPKSGWRYFRPRYVTIPRIEDTGDSLKFTIDRESNDVTYTCKYNFSGYGADGSWSSVDKTSFSGSTCSFNKSTMRSKGASSGRRVYVTVTSDSSKTLGDFSGRENTDSYSTSFVMP